MSHVLKLKLLPLFTMTKLPIQVPPQNDWNWVTSPDAASHTLPLDTGYPVPSQKVRPVEAWEAPPG